MHPGHGLDGRLGPHAHDLGRPGGHDGVGGVEASRQGQSERDPAAVVPLRRQPRATGGTAEGHRRDRAAEAARARPAVPGAHGEGDPTLARRTAHGVEVPPEAGRHPDHPRGRAGTPGHQRVVGVGHHGGPGGRSQGRPPPPGQHADLVGAVQLVAREVQEHHHLGPRRLHQGRQIALVHLEHGRGPRGPGGQRRHVAGRHVRPRGIGDRHGAGRHRPPAGTAVAGGGIKGGCLQGGREQPGGGGLAVGARHQGHPPAGREMGQQRRVDGQPGPAPDHRPSSQAQQPRHGVDRPGHRHRGPRPRRAGHPLAVRGGTFPCG